MEISPISLLSIKLLLLLTTFSFPIHTTSKSYNNVTDLESLLAFKSNLKDPNNIISTNWTTNTSFCNWIGISCSLKHMRVTAIILENYSLEGTISPHLANLSFLSNLYLGTNNLTGPIPQELGHLPRLKILELHENFLIGQIPSSIFNMSSITEMDVSYNNLTGPLPSNRSINFFPSIEFVSFAFNQLTGEIGRFSECKELQSLHLSSNMYSGLVPDMFSTLPNLTELFLSRNKLSGTIPTSIGNFTKLVLLNLGFNNLEGSIPLEVGNLLNLQKISLSLNQLTGRIPSTFGSCKNLKVLSLSFNELIGPIPFELGSLPILELMYLANNSLTGRIPTSVGNLTELVEFDVAYNMLEGVIPNELGNLKNLQYLNLGPNYLTGSIPPSLLNCSKLTLLQFYSNKLTGHVPSSIGIALPSLTRLFLNNNKFSGGLDFIKSLSNCKDLERLSVSNNELDGFLPSSIGNLSTEFLYLRAYGNGINGIIPASLGNLSNLLTLDLGMNKLVGSIPFELTKLNRLQFLSLGNNKMSGSVPYELGALKSLATLLLQNNEFSGLIPNSLSNISRLQLLSLASNRLSSTIPLSLWKLTSLIELDLSQNSLYGFLSPQVGNLQSLDMLDVSFNNLIGNLSGGLGQLQMLTLLNLSKNSFEGGIPKSFSGLINVMYINMSHNLLSGSIPNSLANLPHLTSLDLSYNKLGGQIPEGKVFSNLTVIILEGNSALCGAPWLDFPPCDYARTSSSRKTQKMLKYILPVAILVILATLGLIIVIYYKKKVTNLTQSNFSYLNGETVISYLELVRATNDFNQTNLIGRGGFGSVYRGCLDNGLIVAVKVLNLDTGESASISFYREVRALSMVRHRNLIKTIGVCFDSNFRALVLQFMSNGSLDQWLYSNDKCLSLVQRLDIMVDVSLALEHLHYHHSYMVIHCDLKPSNVLLDDEMVAHVADFGIAKLLLGGCETLISTTVSGGTIGYIPPEYASLGKVSIMGDVYSFGILLLETFTGKKPTDVMFIGELSLRNWIHDLYTNQLSNVVDYTLLENNYEDFAATSQCLSSVIELGLMCSRHSPTDRIPMTTVVSSLHKIREEYMSKEFTATTERA